MIPQNTPLGNLHNGETTIGKRRQRAEQSGHGRDVKTSQDRPALCSTIDPSSNPSTNCLLELPKIRSSTINQTLTCTLESEG